MEFSFDIDMLFLDTITRITGGTAKQSFHNEWLSEVVNKMGLASAQAQGLRRPITTFQKLYYNRETLYILKGENESGRSVVLGMLKLGQRRLFLNDPSGVQHEVKPISILDFYVHESRQRSGCGKKLFEAMMEGERVQPFDVAIDRPSAKFLAFLKKHYNLASYVNQANHFVAFDKFFKTCKDIHHTRKRSHDPVQQQYLRSHDPVQQQYHFHSQVSASQNPPSPFRTIIEESPNDPLLATKTVPSLAINDTIATNTLPSLATTTNTILSLATSPIASKEQAGPKEIGTLNLPQIENPLHKPGKLGGFNWSPDVVSQQNSLNKNKWENTFHRNIITGSNMVSTGHPQAKIFGTNTGLGSERTPFSGTHKTSLSTSFPYATPGTTEQLSSHHNTHGRFKNPLGYSRHTSFSSEGARWRGGKGVLPQHHMTDEYSKGQLQNNKNASNFSQRYSKDGWKNYLS